MGGLECVITGLMDEFCLFFARKKYAREIFTLCAVGVSFTVATVNVTPVSYLILLKFRIKCSQKVKNSLRNFRKIFR